MTAPDPRAGEPPAAPETDESALVPIRRFAEAQAVTAKARGRDDRDWLDALILIDRAEADLSAARERVRVVEGERDAWKATACDTRKWALAEIDKADARAESAEAALRALRAELEALADGDLWEHADTLRALLAGDAR